MNKALLTLAGALWVTASAAVVAQDVPVVDRSNAPAAAGGAARPAAVASPVAVRPPPAAAPAANNQVAELLMTLEQLQEEVRFLRGQVEEQAHAMKKMESDQRDRYRDLDRRISLLTQRLGRQPVAPAPLAATPAAPPVTPSTPAPAPRISDEQAYTQAFTLVRQRKFDASLEAFDEFQRNYPQSKLLPNVLYWTGEVLRAKPEPDLTRAADYYRQVIERFPEHQKAAEAHYKLGLTYDGLGEGAKAIDMMKQVVAQFPDQPPATLARDYLSKH